MSNKVICSKISVDCIPNDPVDVKAGGAAILGYDFFVKESEAPRLVEVIKTAIEEYQLPLIGINILDAGKISLEASKVWTDERIIECIEKEADVIRSEAEHQKIYIKQ